MIKYEIDKIRISDGTELDTSPGGVTIFVGPNNSGKSQALKDILGLIREGTSYQGKTVTNLEFSKTGSAEEAREWALNNLPTTQRAGIQRVQVDGWGDVTPDDFASSWTHQVSLAHLTPSMVLHADGGTRLTSGSAQPSVDFRNQFPTHPIQRAAREPRLEREFDSIGRAAFGLGVTVDRFGGSVIQLRLGERPVFEHNQGSPTDEYLDALAQLPVLEEQGDGVKSYLGLMIQLLAGVHRIVLVDEPEAFLHPPQARLLGRLLAERSSDQQMFISTHSAEIVQGALEAGANVTIVRLRRRGSVNDAAVLRSDDVRSLWADPLLRYSDVLSGLFHDAVVLCESDSDCRYYAAVRDALTPDADAARRPELLFTHCGGKARLHVVIRALRAVKVPVVVVADFDLLRNQGDVRRVVDAAGGDWDAVEANLHLVNSALLSETQSLRRTSTIDALTERIASMGDILTAADVTALRGILKVDTGWEKVKRAGINGVPQGDAMRAAREVLDSLRQMGILVVPVGELERFDPEVGGHGPAWANEVLARSRHLAPTVEARTFVTQIDLAAVR